MADTGAPFSLRYQTINDSPNGAGLGQDLATDTAGWLARAYVVANAAARTSLTGIGTGFLVFQDSDDTFWAWNGSSWIGFGDGTGGGGGGGGGTFVEGQYRASANQSIPNSTDTVIGFGTTETASAVVTRATSGSGHKFTLANTATYGITAVVRFAAGTAGSRFIELRNAAQSTGYVAFGNQGGPAAATLSFSITKQFTAGTELVVIGSQSSGGALSTDYQGSSPTVYRVRLTIVQLG